MNNKPKVSDAKKMTNNKFINMYELNAQRRDSREFSYQVASRAKNIEDLTAISGKVKADAVAVLGMYNNKIVLIKQYRYPVGNYIYELPAGLIEGNEDTFTAAKREMFEETGLNLIPTEVQWSINPWFSSPGMTDETCEIVIGKCLGIPTNKNQEETEDIQVVLADKEEAIRILNTEIVDMRTALAIIMVFNLFNLNM